MSKDEIEKMVNDAEEYKRQDDEKFKNVEAKNALESYLYNTKSALTDEIRGKMSTDEQDQVDSTLKNSLEWLDTHQSEEFSVYNDKQSEVESVIKPIITKLYENANPDAAGGMPSAAEGFGSSEATVEEVD